MSGDDQRRSIEEQYLQALKRMKVRADHLEELQVWKDEILSRLWRAESVLNTTGELKDDMEAIEQEVRWFKRVCKAFRDDKPEG